VTSYVPEQKCTTVQDPVERQVPREDCRQVPRQECEQVPQEKVEYSRIWHQHRYRCQSSLRRLRPWCKRVLHQWQRRLRRS